MDDTFAESQSPILRHHTINDALNESGRNELMKNTLKAEILSEVTQIFNQRIELYFNRDFSPALEAIVDANYANYQSDVNGSILNQTSAKCDCDGRISKLEDMLNPQHEDYVNKEVSKNFGHVENLLAEVKTLTQANQKLTEENTMLREQFNQNVLTVDSSLNQRVMAIENKVHNVEDKMDDGEAHNRKNTLELKGVPDQGTFKKQEDCYEIVKNFCNYYLNFTVRTYDIDIAHRQYNPEEKKRLGKKYIPSIYVKFVNRHVANQIFKRRNRLKNERNRFGGKLSIERNLTRRRKRLLDLAQKELTSYHFKWTTNGDIFVRKEKRSRSIRIINEKMLNDLISAQNCPPNNHVVQQPQKQQSVDDVTTSALPLSSALPNRTPFPLLQCPSPPLSPLQRFPPPMSQQRPPAMTRPPTALGSYANATHTVNNCAQFTPYRYSSRSNFINRNSLLSPSEFISFRSGVSVMNQRLPLNGNYIRRSLS